MQAGSSGYVQLQERVIKILVNAQSAGLAADQAIFKLAKALQRLQRAQPQPRLVEPTIGLLKKIAAASPIAAVRLLISQCHMW